MVLTSGAIVAGLKFLALLSTGIWGVVGLLVDYKKDGRTTKWGKRALTGVIASTLIAAITQGVEYSQQKSAASAANERNYKLLTEIGRAVYPLSPAKAMYLSGQATISLKDASLAKYKLRLETGVKKFVEAKTRSTGGEIWPLPEIDMKTNKSTWIGAEFSPRASLAPKCGREKLACRAFTDFGIDFDIYKTPIKPEYYVAKAPRADLHFRADAVKDSVRMTYRYGAPEIEVYSPLLAVSTDGDWRSNSSISSLNDLGGAQIFFSFKDHDTGDVQVDAGYLPVQDSARIDWIQFHIANRRFFISGFKPIAGTKNTYVYTFPEDLLASPVNLPVQN